METKPLILHLEDFKGEDMPLFVKWLNTERVRCWYSPIEDWIDEVNRRGGEYNWIHHYIIWNGQTPIGFCQYYPYWKSGEEWHGNVPLEKTYSIDYMIGDESYLKKGCGAMAVKLLSTIINDNTDARRIIVQPDSENVASKRTLLSAGYVYDKKNELFILEW